MKGKMPEENSDDGNAVASWYLPAPLGRLALSLLKFLFSGVRFTADQAAVVEQLPDGALLVLVTKHHSRLERLFFYYRHHISGLPCPEIGIGYPSLIFQPLRRLFAMTASWIGDRVRRRPNRDPWKRGAIQQEIRRGKTAILSLVRTGTYRPHSRGESDPLLYLLEMQQTVDRAVVLVPCLFFYGSHGRNGSGDGWHRSSGADPKPGLAYRLFLLMTAPERIFVELSDPVNLMDYIHDPHNVRDNLQTAARTLRHRLLEQITRHRQSITGPILKPVEEIRQHILTSHRMQVFMEKWAARRNCPPAAVRGEAVRYVNEIAARPSPLLIRLGAWLTQWILSSLFDGLIFNMEGLKKMKQMSRKGPLIIMPCHKSNMDSLALVHVMTQNGMPCPHVFAGKNMAFWPMGPIFRRFGAFFVRRSFKGAVFYAKVFSEYIHMLLGQGFNMAVFIEGGRSRNGKLLLPKLGMLSVLLNAVREGACRELHFIPVFIGYDRVPELGSYVHEMEGGQKAPENFWGMLRARKLLKKRFGKIHLKFCDPISLGDLVGGYGRTIEVMTPKELNRLCRDAAGRIMAAVDGNTIVTHQALVSASLLNHTGPLITRKNLMEGFETYLDHLVFLKADISESLRLNSEQAMNHVLDHYAKARFIIPVDGNGKAAARYRINTVRRPAMDYYKNNCIAHFVPAAFTAMAILRQDAFLFNAGDLHADYRFLADIFRYEFNRSPDEEPDQPIESSIDAFLKSAIIRRDPDFPQSYRLTPKGFRAAKRFARFLKPLFESYLVTLVAQQRAQANGRSGSDGLKIVQSTGHRMYKNREIDGRESLSTVNYENALEFLRRNRLNRTDAADLRREVEATLRSCLRLL